jgi:hypothetical protein
MFPKITNIEYDGDNYNIVVQYGGRKGYGCHPLFSVAVYMAMWDLWASK